jgi:hypothetical protein
VSRITAADGSLAADVAWEPLLGWCMTLVGGRRYRLGVKDRGPDDETGRTAAESETQAHLDTAAARTLLSARETEQAIARLAEQGVTASAADVRVAASWVADNTSRHWDHEDAGIARHVARELGHPPEITRDWDFWQSALGDLTDHITRDLGDPPAD